MVYWGWINLGLVVVFGDKGWWAWGVVPVLYGVEGGEDGGWGWGDVGGHGGCRG